MMDWKENEGTQEKINKCVNIMLKIHDGLQNRTKDSVSLEDQGLNLAAVVMWSKLAWTHYHTMGVATDK